MGVVHIAHELDPLAEELARQLTVQAQKADPFRPAVIVVPFSRWG